jgi:serine/threonine-protein kinase
MTRTLWKRGKSLRREGLKLRRVFLARRSSSVVEAAPLPTSRQLRKLAPREVLASAYGSAIRRAAEERVAILGIVKALGKADRALLPEVVPTVHGLVDRVANLAKALHRLDAEYDPSQIPGLDERIASAERAPDTTDALRHLALLRRQRVAMEHFGRQRGTLLRQLESAGLALSNLRLDLVKLRTSGLEAGLEDLTSATQEARVLSRDIGMALEAVVEVRRI